MSPHPTGPRRGTTGGSTIEGAVEGRWELWQRGTQPLLELWPGRGSRSFSNPPLFHPVLQSSGDLLLAEPNKSQAEDKADPGMQTVGVSPPPPREHSRRMNLRGANQTSMVGNSLLPWTTCLSLPRTLVTSSLDGRCGRLLNYPLTSFRSFLKHPLIRGAC